LQLVWHYVDVFKNGVTFLRTRQTDRQRSVSEGRDDDSDDAAAAAAAAASAARDELQTEKRRQTRRDASVRNMNDESITAIQQQQHNFFATAIDRP